MCTCGRAATRSVPDLRPRTRTGVRRRRRPGQVACHAQGGATAGRHSRPFPAPAGTCATTPRKGVRWDVWDVRVAVSCAAARAKIGQTEPPSGRTSTQRSASASDGLAIDHGSSPDHPHPHPITQPAPLKYAPGPATAGRRGRALAKRRPFCCRGSEDCVRVCLRSAPPPNARTHARTRARGAHAPCRARPSAPARPVPPGEGRSSHRTLERSTLVLSAELKSLPCRSAACVLSLKAPRAPRAFGFPAGTPMRRRARARGALLRARGAPVK